MPGQVADDGEHPPTMADFAGDLLRLLDHVGWDRCLAVGISFAAR